MGNMTDPVYDLINQLLSFLYWGVFCVSIVIVFRLPSTWTWQKMFHTIICVGTLIRSVFFFLQTWIHEDEFKLNNQTNIILNSAPTFLFIGTYMLLLFFWAELLQKGSDPSTTNAQYKITSLRSIYLIINLIIWTSLITLYILDLTLYSLTPTNTPELATPIDHAIWIFLSSIGLLTAIGFLIYGIRMFRMVLILGTSHTHSWSALSPTKRYILIKVAIISALCTLGFLCRAGVNGLAASHIDSTAFAHSWWINLGYFGVLEVLPLLLILYILHLGTSHKKKDDEDFKNVVRNTNQINSKTFSGSLNFNVNNKNNKRPTASYRSEPAAAESEYGDDDRSPFIPKVNGVHGINSDVENGFRD